jgi:hypothetical protein
VRSIDPLVRSKDEIVRDIVKKIDDDRVGAAEVCDEIARWRELALIDGEPVLGYRSDNMAYAKRLQQWGAEGERLIRGAPGGGPFAVIWCAPNADGVVPAVEQVKKEHDALRQLLLVLREKCKAVMKQPPGRHRRSGWRQRGAAYIALRLCEKAGKPLATASSTSAFREVASLIFEALTGQHGANLERACKYMVAGRKT